MIWDGNSTESCDMSVPRNKAIADYLSANGFHTALEHFQKEASMVSKLYKNILEFLMSSVE